MRVHRQANGITCDTRSARYVRPNKWVSYLCSEVLKYAQGINPSLSSLDFDKAIKNSINVTVFSVLLLSFATYPGRKNKLTRSKKGGRGRYKQLVNVTTSNANLYGLGSIAYRPKMELKRRIGEKDK